MTMFQLGRQCLIFGVKLILKTIYLEETCIDISELGPGGICVVVAGLRALSGRAILWNWRWYVFDAMW